MATIVSSGSERIKNLSQKLLLTHFHRIRKYSSNDFATSHQQSCQLFRHCLVRSLPAVYDLPGRSLLASAPQNFNYQPNTKN